MKTVFWKMHGAGNDFILVDDRAARFPVSDPEVVRRWCDRHAGVGSEGLILLRPAGGADFQMLFFNPDGSAGEMCGNGARCAARLAYDLKLAPAEMTMATGAGLVRAAVRGANVRLDLPPPVDWQLNLRLELPGGAVVCHAVNTGVPHAVLETNDLAAADLAARGPLIRRHPRFAPRGTNVDFMAVRDGRTLGLRTYERGVEAETLACGTGAAAAALVAGRLGKVRPPVRVVCARGDVLEVDYRLSADGAADLALTGPAVYVFEGRMDAAD